MSKQNGMAREMVTVAEAKNIILSHTVETEPEKIALSQAAGMVLAEDIFATIDIPAYAQSSMDGYAFSFADLKANQPLRINGVVAAGSTEATAVSTGNAARIFTGAPVPDGTDTVVMQEKTKVEGDSLYIEDGSIKKGLNVRLKGSEIKAGDLAVAKDCLLMPAAIGFLAGIGVTEVLVYPYPVVSIIVTGNELQAPGQPLQPGQIYESNSFLLRAALRQLHITEVKVYKAEDTLETVKRVLNEAMEKSDIVFLTGGVSVGDYDFVAAAAKENGIEKVFHKIKQKPGKPFYFGKKENKLVFGLPGNPASVLTCFYEYVEPALKQMLKQKTSLRVIQAPLAEPFKKPAGLTHFLKGYYDGITATALHAQESYRLSSFANANCLIKIEEEVTACEKGHIVEIHLLPV
jgi:molybdopterin molybdotransferase